MKLIPISKGYYAKVDDADYDLLSKFRWISLQFFRRDGTLRCVYVLRYAKEDGKRKTIYMHRQIMGLGGGRSIEVDHRDNDGLNNQRFNLRIGDRCQQMANSRTRFNNPTGVKGVYREKSSGKWVARLTVNFRQHRLGTFSTLAEAAEARRLGSIKYHGEFANDGAIVSAMSVGD